MIDIYFSGSQNRRLELQVGAYIKKEDYDEVIDIEPKKFYSKVGAQYIALVLLLKYLIENNITSDIRLHNQDLIMIKLVKSILDLNIKSESLSQIKELLEHFNNIEFLFIKRNDNLKAIQLARKGYNNKFDNRP